MDIIVHKCNVKLLDGVNMSSNHTSDAFNIQSFSLYCAQFAWSGFSGVDALIEILGSNSLEEPFISVDTYTPSGTTGGRLVNVEKAGYAYIKLKYSCSSGMGTLTASINGKVI